MTSRPGPALLLMCAAAVAALALTSSAGAAKTPDVFINGDSPSTYKFTPKTFETKRRKTVKWSWDSNGAHNVTIPKLGKSSITGASETYRLKFKRRGTFKYLCTVHSFRGKVVVKKR
jgi:plastocyanin